MMKRFIVFVLFLIPMLFLDAQSGTIPGINRKSTGGLSFAERKSLDETIDQCNVNYNTKATLASPIFTGTVVIPSPFTLGATSVTTTGTKLNYLTSATGTTGTNTTNIVFSTSPSITTPTFVTSITMGSAELNEAELEILDGATTTTAQLNYLNTATGTTGTNTTNLVYSTSPVLITPALGTPSALVGTNISGTGASFTAGAVTGFTPASGTLTLAGADAVTITTTATTNVTLPTTGTLVASSVTDLLAPKASPTVTGTVTAPIISQTATVSEITTLITLDSTKLAGSTAGRLGHVDGAILVAAPGAGSLLEFVSALLIYDFGTAAYTGGGDDVVIQIGGSGTQVALSGTITGANLLEAAADKVIQLGATATELVPVVNKALSIAGTTLINGGTATGQLRVHLTYRIHILGL